MTRLQISSGQGPVECELAVAKFAEALCAEFSGAVVSHSTPGVHGGCFKSVVIESQQDLSHLEGSIKWICQSPFRPNHRRKNWFIDVSPVRRFDEMKLDDTLISFDTFRSSGKGGQNVNKVETGVRATYLPLGISVTSTDERSQHMNKKRALERLHKKVAEQNKSVKRNTDRTNWLEHTRLERGNAVRVYEGMDFRRVK